MENPHLAKQQSDFLYHLGINIPNTSDTSEIQRSFGDIKVVCMGGTKSRMAAMAQHVRNLISPDAAKEELVDMCEGAHRYAMYKVGPVLCCSHGIGMPSIGVLLHELIKLLRYAKCVDPVFIRIGTCGGLGVTPGTVIISEEALDGQLRNSHEFMILGKIIRRPAKLDRKLAHELKSLASTDDNYDTIIGKTLCTNDFYEGQGRLDGAFCEFSEADKMAYLQLLRQHGVVNFEMESAIFAALTYHAGIRAAVICAPLVNRLDGDQVIAPNELISEWEKRPLIFVTRYIQKLLS